MAEEQFLKWISCILDNDVLPVETVLSEIYEVKQYLEEQCRDVEEMEEFLSTYDEHFTVENGRVTVYDSQLESGREKAVEYFEGKLSLYDERPNYFNFRGHIGQADNDVIYFINTFYPEEEFKDFLLGHPDVFVVFDDDTVSLVETECVDYFRKFLRSCGTSVMNLRSYNWNAPQFIKSYVERCYPGEDFLEFLENNSEVFYVENGYVYLNSDE